MSKKIYPKDYQTLFRLDVVKGRVTGLLSDFIIHGSLGLANPIITFDGKWWTFRLYKKSEVILAKKGLQIFRNKILYPKYAKEFRQYIRFVDKNIVSRYKNAPSEISKKFFFELVNELQKFWYYYGITEFVYHDLAHRIMIETKDEILEKNLADLEKLKFEGRALLNSFILENGTIDNILKCVSQRYSIDEDIVKYFFLQDLKSLFVNKRINLSAIKQRRKSFVVVHMNKRVRYLEGKEAIKIAQSFTKFEQAEFKKAANGLEGCIANKGIARGKVVISPMLDIKAAMEVEKRMKKGDILIVQSTNPDLMALCNKAGAIVTDQGGMLSHAAIISRELGIPCIVGTTNGTKVFKDGDFIEVDANNGIVKIIEKKEIMFMKTFKQLSKNDAHIAGGKGASLGEMTNNKIPVPPGFVVLAHSFDRFLKGTGLDFNIETMLKKVNHKKIDSVEAVAGKIRNLILDEEFPKDIAMEIQKEFIKLKARSVAVRSSATAEDSSNASWAGELESYLNTTKIDLLANIKKCWASLFTPRAIFYRFEKKLRNQKISVAVVVQKMIQSEISGIAFTVHPVTKDYKQMIIEAGYGLGEAIVGGKITPDAYIVNKNPKMRILEKNISEQTMMIVRDKQGVKEAMIPKFKQNKQKLTDAQILKLAKICRNIENHYKKPQDIEWAFEKGKFYIVQSRPITTL